ncbi:MAG: radical SAM protein [Candidatus Saliniplasma sp.]
MKIRVSSGTASYLSLQDSKILEDPTTAYLLVPGKKCRGACRYCPQGKGDSRWLSRVSWPLFESEIVSKTIKDSDLDRICLQSPDIDGYEEKIRSIVGQLEEIGKPISISSPPLPDTVLEDIKGPVDHIGVGIDAVTNDIRKKTKPNYPPLLFWDYLGRAIDIFGGHNVIAHLIVGMGEDLEQLGATVKRTFDIGAKVSLFPLLLKDHEVDMYYYRKAQLLTYLIGKGNDLIESLEIVQKRPYECIDEIEDGEIFRTRGCPGCNRPFYTTKPGKEHKNYPRKLNLQEINQVKKELGIL